MAQSGCFRYSLDTGVQTVFGVEIGVQIATQWQAALTTACNPVTITLPWYDTYGAPPKAIITTVCSNAIPARTMLDLAALSIVFSIATIAVPYTAGGIVGGTVGLAVSHAFEAAYVAQINRKERGTRNPPLRSVRIERARTFNRSESKRDRVASGRTGREHIGRNAGQEENLPHDPLRNFQFAVDSAALLSRVDRPAYCWAPIGTSGRAQELHPSGAGLSRQRSIFLRECRRKLPRKPARSSGPSFFTLFTSDDAGRMSHL